MKKKLKNDTCQPSSCVGATDRKPWWRSGDCYRYLCALLVLVCLLSTAGCSGDQEGELFPESTTPDVADSGVERIILTYQTMQNSILTDLDEVVDAINAITIPEIGVEVELRTVDAQDALVEYPLWISRGENVDLMMLNYQDITTYISRGMLYPLDDLLETDGQDILQIKEEGYDLTEGSVVKGSTYGVGIVPDMLGSGMGLWVPKALLEELEWTYDENHIYTMEELSDFFAACKALYPDSYSLGQITSGANYTFYTYYGGKADALGGSYASGVLDQDGQIVNLFETEGYYAFLQQMREWYLAGYIYPDAAFTDTYSVELAQNHMVLSYPYISAPGSVGDGAFGEETVVLRTSEITIGRQSSKGVFWTIPTTSSHTEAAMRFLNMMYADGRITNLLQYGIKSKHYVVLDVETGSIAYPYGVSRQSTGYYNPLGLYGDRRKMYTFDSNAAILAKEAYSREAVAEENPAPNFVYVTDQVNLELTAVQQIVDEYLPILESGCVDLDTCYPQFLTQLRLAGLERVLEDKQAQYDAWRRGE